MAEKCDVCVNESRIALLEKQFHDVKEGQDREEAFRKTYYADREVRIKRDAELDAKLRTMVEQLDGIKSWVDEQRDKPRKRLDVIVEKILTLLAAAVVGFVLARIGL